MILYGKIKENGLLSIVEVKERKEARARVVGKDDQAHDIVEHYKHTVTVEEQAAELVKSGWKPTDLVDMAVLSDHGEHEMVIPIPHDTGDRITYTYEKVIDKEGINRKIDSLIKEVAATDYQVRKCQEYALVGKPLPYDIQAIHAEAEAIRIKIRELENLI